MIPWHEKTWCIPPAADAEFVARMEDLLELYQVPYDARRPVVCMDELCKQLIAETRVPLPVRERHPARYDYEYERKGVCSLFVFVEPRRGWRNAARERHEESAARASAATRPRARGSLLDHLGVNWLKS